MAEAKPGRAWEELEATLDVAQGDFVAGVIPDVPRAFGDPRDSVFRSPSGSYREVLPGFCLAKLQNPSVDLRLPYTSHGANSYNGRTLDTRVVNPFLNQNRFPAGKSPYLAVFRRQFRFIPENREQLRDKDGYDNLLNCLDYLQSCATDEQVRQALVYVIWKFIRLRETSELALSRLRRISLTQYDRLIERLIATKSGGRLPVFLIQATLHALNQRFALGWTIDVQGINVADRSAGAPGDVVVRRGAEVVLAAEVTEREVDQNRVVTTFNTKVAPHALEDYIFFVTRNIQPDAALRQMQAYFAQGHEISFVEIRGWMAQVLVLLGKTGREHFNAALFDLLTAPDTPNLVKAAWNEAVDEITAVS